MCKLVSDAVLEKSISFQSGITIFNISKMEKLLHDFVYEIAYMVDRDWHDAYTDVMDVLLLFANEILICFQNIFEFLENDQNFKSNPCLSSLILMNDILFTIGSILADLETVDTRGDIEDYLDQEGNTFTIELESKNYARWCFGCHITDALGFLYAILLSRLCSLNLNLNNIIARVIKDASNLDIPTTKLKLSLYDDFIEVIESENTIVPVIFKKSTNTLVENVLSLENSCQIMDQVEDLKSKLPLLEPRAVCDRRYDGPKPLRTRDMDISKYLEGQALEKYLRTREEEEEIDEDYSEGALETLDLRTITLEEYCIWKTEKFDNHGNWIEGKIKHTYTYTYLLKIFVKVISL